MSFCSARHFLSVAGLATMKFPSAAGSRPASLRGGNRPRAVSSFSTAPSRARVLPGPPTHAPVVAEAALSPLRCADPVHGGFLGVWLVSPSPALTSPWLELSHLTPQRCKGGWEVRAWHPGPVPATPRHEAARHGLGAALLGGDTAPPRSVPFPGPTPGGRGGLCLARCSEQNTKPRLVPAVPRPLGARA